MEDDDIYAYSLMTIDELKQLKEMTEQALQHYTGLLKEIKEESEMEDLEKRAMQLCYDMMKKDLDEIEKELSLRA
jgi:hypothetical protein